MKHLISIFLLFVSIASATQFKCLSKRGWGYGTGRYSYHGEYSYYWRVYANENEFVLFQYNGYGKVYWFKSNKCIEL